MCISLAACGNNTEETEETTTTTADSATEPSTGDDSTGDDSTGDDSTGDDSTGDDSTGDDSTGDDSTGDDVKTYNNETDTLIVQESTFDGVFNPFFYSSAYDGDVVGFVNVGLLTVDASGAVVAGDEYDTVAQSYSIYYTNDLSTYAAKDTYEEGDYVVYEMVLKNGAKFSDGTPITAEDVLFNYYVLLDPAYVGSSTLYTLPILGLNDYRTQVAGYDEVAVASSAALAMGPNGYKTSSYVTKEQYDFYWSTFKTQEEAFAQSIVDYVNSKYQGYVSAYFRSDWTYDDVNTEGRKIAFGMSLWGFGDYADDGEFYGNASGKKYDVEALTIADYVYELETAYISGDDYAEEYADMDDTEAAYVSLLAPVETAFVAQFGEATTISGIAGIVAGATTVDGESHETVKIILTEQNPKAILSLGVTVAPKGYYTAGFEYTDGAMVTAGVQLGLNGDSAFMSHLQTLNSAPLGAGCYVFVSYDGDGVTLVRNEYHETLGGDNVYNAKIKNVYLKVIESGSEYDALKAGDVHYSNPSATADVVSEIATIANLTSILVDNLGYGYICVNPSATDYGLDNLYARIALTTVFDMAKVLDYYPSGLADIIYRSQSQVSWAYPEGATAIYAFDDTLASAINYYKLAGYTYDSATGKFTNVPEIDFYLPSNTDDHPAGGIFLRAQELLATIGITANIKVDSNLIADIKASHIPVYALAWSSSQDPDMYQVYHYASAAESVFSNGIKWLHDNGNSNDLGTIEVTKLDGSKVTMNQKEALDYLAELIEQGVKYMSVEERTPIYAKALEVLAQLNIEVPTYQRKNMFAYDNTIIDATSLSSNVTPYWGPMAELWKVSFVNGDAN